MGKSSSPTQVFQPPQYAQPAPDPLFLAQQQRATKDQALALQTQSGMDTAAIMSRYGSFSAMGGSGVAPLSGAPAAITTAPLGLGLMDSFALLRLGRAQA